MRRTVIAALSLLILGAGSHTAQAQTPEVLDQLVDDWAVAFNSGDMAKVASGYAEDAIRMAPEGDMQVGREAITAALMLNAGATIVLETLGGAMDGDLAARWGTFELSMPGEDGEAMSVSGRWMNTLKNTSAGWKIYRDIWNWGPDGISPADM